MKNRPHLYKRSVQGAVFRDRRSVSAYYAGPGEAETPAGNGTQPSAKEDCHNMSRSVNDVPVHKSLVPCESDLWDVVLVGADGCDHSGRMQVSTVVDACSRQLLGVLVA